VLVVVIKQFLLASPSESTHFFISGSFSVWGRGGANTRIKRYAQVRKAKFIHDQKKHFKSRRADLEQRCEDETIMFVWLLGVSQFLRCSGLRSPELVGSGGLLVTVHQVLKRRQQRARDV
jgi:hypothetical protein